MPDEKLTASLAHYERQSAWTADLRAHLRDLQRRLKRQAQRFSERRHACGADVYPQS